MKPSPRHLALTIGNIGNSHGSGFYWEVMEAGRDAAGIPKIAEIARLSGYMTYGEALLAGNDAWRRLMGMDMKGGCQPGLWARFISFLLADPKRWPFRLRQRSSFGLPASHANHR